MPPKDHTVLIVVCITAIGIVSLACATILIMKGYTAELMVGIAAGGAGSLGTMLGQRRAQPGSGPGDTNVAGNATVNVAPATDTQP